MNVLQSGPVLPDSSAPETGELGLYLHVPFCLRKCPYCSFYSVPGRSGELHRKYVQSAMQQIRRVADFRDIHNQPLTSIFFGGGTPTILPAEILSSLLASCREHFSCIDKPEISIEVNPATVDAAALDILHRGGFNRLSIGVQSFNNAELQRLGRPHSAEEAVQTVLLARRAGFRNINLDMIYGLPEQNIRAWQHNLEQALRLRPEHLSIYELTVEADTPFAHRQEQGNLPMPDEDSTLWMLDTTRRLSALAGFRRYEISNYAKPGFQCRHNINYWRNGSYIGLGPGAFSFLDGIRSSGIADVIQFCELMEQGRAVQQGEERLGREAAFRETLVMGLRMTAGVSLHSLHCRFGIDAVAYYGDTLKQLVQEQLLGIIPGRLRLTDRGLLLADTVMAKLV